MQEIRQFHIEAISMAALVSINLNDIRDGQMCPISQSK
jgi:hypothetical protein